MKNHKIEKKRRHIYGLALAVDQLPHLKSLKKKCTGEVCYSTDEPHYNDPYGYFVSGVASCAGCARATGLCLDMLGIPYEHMNENQWSHQ